MKSFKHLLIFFLSFISVAVFAQNHNEGETEKTATTHETAKQEGGFNANKVIFDHILNKHEFHFLEINNKPVTLSLPIILYSPQRGFSCFMSSKFHHGLHPYNGYKVVADDKIVAVKDDGETIDEAVKVYDISLSRNVVQMLIAMCLFLWIMLSIAKKYRKGDGVKNAPTGMQNLIEPVITFMRDETIKPILQRDTDKYLPYILCVFFFILINNLFGLIPGSANVTGNIAFTAIMGVIAFIVILISTSKHFWGHIFNPPGVPGGIKPILVLIEFLSIFTKPFALIIRLFANMLAGHIIIISLISLIFIFGNINKGIGWGFSPISVAFTVFIYCLEILVAFIQAYVFAFLTTVFIGQSLEGKHHHEEEIVI